MTDRPDVAALAEALAYALARAALPTDTETSHDYADRLAPLVIESGYLTNDGTVTALRAALDRYHGETPCTAPTYCNDAALLTDTAPAARAEVERIERPWREALTAPTCSGEDVCDVHHELLYDGECEDADRTRLDRLYALERALLERKP